MVVRLKANSRASSRSAGRRVPGGSSPTSMARAIEAASCSLSGSAPDAHGPSSSTRSGAETIDCLFSPLDADWLFVSSVMQSNMEPYQSTVKTNPSPGSNRRDRRKGLRRCSIRSQPPSRWPP